MKELTKMSRVVGTLEKMFRALNEDKFSGELPMPIITVQSRPGTWGSCSVNPIWNGKEGKQYEMNFAAEAINGPVEEIIDTLVHEMVHLYCRLNGIQEVSRGGKYHNKKFKALAEEKGCIVVEEGQYGWNTQGRGNDGFLQYAIDKGWTEIMICRDNTYFPGLLELLEGGKKEGKNTITPAPGKKPSSTRKLECPQCKTSVRATKKVNIICGDCMVQMVEV